MNRRAAEARTLASDRTGPGRHPDRADHAARVAALALFLPPADRELLLAVFDQGRPIRDLAALMNVSASALRRRIRILARRAARPEFLAVARLREGWPPRLRSVADACIIQGRSIRRAAADLDRTFHDVRRARAEVLTLARAAARSDASADGPTTEQSFWSRVHPVGRARTRQEAAA